MIDNDVSDGAGDAATPIFDAVQRYITGLRAVEGGTARVADRLAEAMGVGIPDVIAAAKAVAATASFSGEGQVTAEGQVIAEGGLRLPKLAFAGVAEVTVTAGEMTAATGVMRPEDVGALSARASREGIAGLSQFQVLALVLAWLLALGLPFLQEALPSEVQAVMSNQYGTIGVALGITAIVLSGRK